MFELLTLFFGRQRPHTMQLRRKRACYKSGTSWFVVLCNKQCGKKPETSGFFLRNVFFFTTERQAAGFARNSKAIGTPAHFLRSAPSTTTTSITRICRKGEDLRFHAKYNKVQC